VDDGEHGADDTLGRQGWWTVTPLPFKPAFVHDGDDSGEDAAAALKRPGSRSERLHDHEPAHTGLIVEDFEQRDQCGSDLRPPRAGVLIRGNDLAGDARDRVVERGQEAVLAILEQLVERTPRDARAGDDARDRHIGGATLSDDIDHRGENPRALDLGDLPAVCPLGMPVRVLPA